MAALLSGVICIQHCAVQYSIVSLSCQTLTSSTISSTDLYTLHCDCAPLLIPIIASHKSINPFNALNPRYNTYTMLPMPIPFDIGNHVYSGGSHIFTQVPNIV